MLKPYPTWVCRQCGLKARGRAMPTWSIATFHVNKCDVCGETKDVTEPRDYGYPMFEGHKYEDDRYEI